MPYLRFFSALSDALVAFAVGGGYVTLFLVTVLEGLPLLGVLIPGHVAIIAAGFIAATGIFNIWVVMAVAIVGAVIGDFLSFTIGRRYGMPLIQRFRSVFFIRQSHIDKASRLVESHTGKSLIIGRFNPLTRGIMPFMVGAGGVAPRSFWPFNILGAVLWVVSSVLLGYILGLGYHSAAGMFGKMIVVAVIVSLLIIWGYRFVNARFHIFRRYELFALGLNVLSLYILARMIQDVFVAHSVMDCAIAGTNAVSLVCFDIRVNAISAGLASGIHGQSLIAAASWASSVGGLTTVSVLTVIGGLYLALRKRWRSVAILLLSVGSTAIMVGWMKDIVGRLRPENMYAPLWASLGNDPSFPSAHAAFAAAFLTAIAYLFAPHIRSWVRRELFMTACVIAAIAIGLSRIVLNAHWASDVIAGWAHGVFCATGSILLVRYIGELIMGKRA
jgi:undecaprenyl-diphosphatase